MKKLLLTIVALLFTTPVFADQYFVQSNPGGQYALFYMSSSSAASSIVITDTTAITLEWAKSDGTYESEACAASGTDHDCTVVGGGIYKVEVAADKVDTLKTAKMCVVHSLAVFYCESLWVQVSASSALFTTTGPSTVNDIRDSILADSTPFNGADIDATLSDIEADVARAFLVKGNVATALLIGPFRDSNGDIVATGTPTCTLRSNSSTTYSAVTNAASAVDAKAYSLWTVAAAESSGKTVLGLYCELTDAEPFFMSVRVQ